MANICILGKGSIGIRHGKIFSKLGYNIFFFRQRKKKLSIKINYKYEEIENLNELKKKKFDLFVISSPTSQHLRSIIKILKKKINILIEKPLVSNNKDLLKLKSLYNKNNINIFVGYQFRHDPRIKIIKNIISKNYKKIRYANFKLQTYMPRWHPWENFRTSYASQKKLGGGVLLTCSHEIDLACDLFGEAKKVFCLETKSNLRTNVENSVILTIQHYTGVISNLILDFACSGKEVRTFRIILENKEIVCDLRKKNIILKTDKNLKIINPKKSVSINNIYNYQNFKILNKIKKLNKAKRPAFKTISSAERVIFAAKKSIKTQKFEKLN
ncbi:Gfo/Idh/MocA family oxidoreductase [Pelagibacteraceae bacterium]|nr:Gfo/Idh/MocA family oxidoreductase [Pelagibacteraceae bacterium]